MSRSHIVLLALVALMTAACGRAPDTIGASRLQNFLLDDPVADAYWQETELTRNAIALEDSIREMTVAARKDTSGNGCSGKDLSDPSMAYCTERQMKNGWMGGLANLGIGGREVSPEALSPAMADIFAQLEAVDDGIDQLLIAQRTETMRLQKEMTMGLITRPVYDARLAEMRESRKVVAQTLALSSDRAVKARRMLERAQSDGQDGLSWYVMSMQRIEQMAQSGQTRLVQIEG